MPATVQSDTQLLIACWATVIVLVAMALVFLRSKRRRYALAVLPLTFPPSMYIISGVIARTIDSTLPFATSVQIRIVLDLAAALAACMVIGLISGYVSKVRRTRVAFLICCSLFVVAFSSLLIMSSVIQFNALPIA